MEQPGPGVGLCCQCACLAYIKPRAGVPPSYRTGCHDICLYFLTWEVKAGGQKFKVNQITVEDNKVCMRPCLKKKKVNKGKQTYKEVLFWNTQGKRDIIPPSPTLSPWGSEETLHDRD